MKNKAQIDGLRLIRMGWVDPQQEKPACGCPVLVVDGHRESVFRGIWNGEQWHDSSGVIIHPIWWHEMPTDVMTQESINICWP